MKKAPLLGIFLTLTVACVKQQEPTLDHVIKKFYENSEGINEIEFIAHRIDTFPDGTVWNNTGIAIIEKNNQDDVLGFSFYGKRDDVPEEYIYHNGQLFEISNADSAYETSMGGYGVLGSPGGQMIPQDIFHLDSTFKSISLEESEKSYILKYEFEANSVNGIMNRVKTIELLKNNYLPWRITRTYSILGKRAYHQIEIDDIKVNESVQNSIIEYLKKIKDYEIIQPKRQETNKLLNNKMPTLSLPNLLDQNKIVELHNERLTLIDFWEVWCGPCMASLPKAQYLHMEFEPDLVVIGVVSEDLESAKKILKEKSITFLNLVGTPELKKEFNVNSIPRYFLISREGIVLKEYFGFSEQIEADIRQVLED
jgi:thiol-disulfide isomerase/thioredoxin